MCSTRPRASSTRTARSSDASLVAAPPTTSAPSSARTLRVCRPVAEHTDDAVSERVVHPVGQIAGQPYQRWYPPFGPGHRVAAGSRLPNYYSIETVIQTRVSRDIWSVIRLSPSDDTRGTVRYPGFSPCSCALRLIRIRGTRARAHPRDSPADGVLRRVRGPRVCRPVSRIRTFAFETGVFPEVGRRVPP